MQSFNPMLSYSTTLTHTGSYVDMDATESDGAGSDDEPGSDGGDSD
jgi:hypothetical protein